jgi:hypothetical protein
MSLLVRWMSRGSAEGMALTFLYLSYLIVPGSVAVAVVFWRVYSFVAGKRFVTRVAWGEVAVGEVL